jgi:hypothetical protein
MMTRALSILFVSMVCGRSTFPQAPETRLNPKVKQIIDSISEQRIAATLKKLESFGTRYVLSSQDDPVHGIGAAKRWIHDELQSYSPRLEVNYQNFTVKKGARQGMIIRDVETVQYRRGASGHSPQGSLCAGNRAL